MIGNCLDMILGTCEHGLTHSHWGYFNDGKPVRNCPGPDDDKKWRELSNRATAVIAAYVESRAGDAAANDYRKNKKK